MKRIIRIDEELLFALLSLPKFKMMDKDAAIEIALESIIKREVEFIEGCVRITKGHLKKYKGEK